MKLLAADYDGTIRYAKHIMNEDIEALHRWKEAGNILAIVTGRSMESMMLQQEMYHLPADYYITNNGGMVWDADGNKLNSTYLNEIAALDIIYACREQPGVVSYVVNDGYNRHRIIVNDSLNERRYPNLKPDLTEEEVENLGKYAQIVLSMSDVLQAQHLAEQINIYFSDHVVAYPNNYVVDVVPQGISKLVGIEYVSAYSGVPEEDTYTIGDSFNDIPMLEYGIHTAAMETAYQEVKDHAMYTYSSVSEMINTILDEE